MSDARPLLCVTVTAPTLAEMRRRRDAVRDADLVELRLDSVTDPDVAGALAGRTRPVVITCRPIWEGGHFTGSEEERHRLLAEAFDRGAEYVDVEWNAHFDDLLAAKGGRGIVLSTHDFERTPGDLVERARAMHATGAEVVKLAAMATRLSDCVVLQRLGQSVLGQGQTVVIGMGERGIITRVLPERFGSRWTYAGSIAHIGQIDASMLLEGYGFRSLGPSTDAYGLVGAPISHSVSPAMHNAAFRSAGVDAVYLPFPAVDADDFMAFARGVGLKGASVTIPFKVPLYERMDDTDPTAQQTGAINTILASKARWFGANTDADGFLRPLVERGILLRGRRAAVLGAGGSARAVANALTRSGATVSVHARDLERASDATELSGASAAPWPPEPGTWDLLVNCTPVGMHPSVDHTPVPRSALTGQVVYDLVYNPIVTRLVREAAEVGCVTIGGLDMLVAQAEEQFRLWTGIRPSPAVMREAALKRLAEFVTDEDHVV